jgi:zinc-binding alcohol dehydrogenase/oxidoreductase
MKTLVLTGKNEPLLLQERPDLQVSEGEALVRIHAAALNHRDVWIQKGQYAGVKYPIVPGSDGAGVVVEIGGPEEQESRRSWLGKEVIINPSLDWGNYPSHQDQKSFRILGLPDDGTFAEYVKVPVANLAEKPAHLSFEEAAAIPLAGVTAYRALFTRAELRIGTDTAGAEKTATDAEKLDGGTGEKVLITGIGGGVALFALQYAVAAGAEVYVTSGSEEKLQKAVALGARGGVNYTQGNWGPALQEMAGSFDVIVDGAAGDGIDELLNLAAPGGRLAFYGATRGNPSSLVARRIFWKQLTILGSTMGNPEDFRSMNHFINQHTLRPVVDKVFPFADGESALRWMDSARQFGKIVLKIC